MKAQTYFWILAGLMAVLVSACSRKIAVSPNPNSVLTRTPTFTITPTRTQSATPTETSTGTSTPSMTQTRTSTITPTATDTLVSTSTATDTRTETPSPTPTETSTDTPVPTDTDTPVAPVDTDTETPTATETATQGIVCTLTPVSPTNYSELEIPTDGGPTGTNDTCGTAENVGILDPSSPLVISGVLSSTGAGGFDLTKDWDYYQFTVGTSASYTLTVDCFSTGTDTNMLDILIWDTAPTCNYLFDPGAWQPVNWLQGNLGAAEVYNVAIYGYNGAAPVPYRFTISSP